MEAMANKIKTNSSGNKLSYILWAKKNCRAKNILNPSPSL
jgi:hypothetical protein